VSTRGASEVLAAYDDKPDGKLDRTEFGRLVKDIESGATRAVGRPAVVKSGLSAIGPKVSAVLARFDRTGGGYLDDRDLRDALQHYGIDVSSRAAKQAIAAYDRPDGQLDRFEFTQLVRDIDSGVTRPRASNTSSARVSSVFERYDRNRSGYLDCRELRSALQHYGLDVSSRGAQQVLAAYDDHPDGKLEKSEFAELVRDIESGATHTGSARTGSTRATSRRPGPGPGASSSKSSSSSKISAVFELYDRNRSGYLDYRELRKAVSHYGLDVSTRGAQQILAAYDDHPDGKLEKAEFAELVRDIESGATRAGSTRATSSRPGTSTSSRRPGASSTSSSARVSSVFERYDRNGSGYLDYRELRSALQHYGVDVSSRGAQQVLAAYDDYPDGKLEKAEFAELVHDIESGATRAGSAARSLARPMPTFQAEVRWR